MPTAADWTRRFLDGDPRALARALSWAEAGADAGRELVGELRRRGLVGRARLVGVTGSPGVGKSTLVDALVARWHEGGASVAVLAIDPSSPFTGGALLGDRVRMARGTAHADVFVRSMASRGRTGGLAPAVLEALALFDGFGFDLVVLETVGVGQAEVDVVAVADTVVVAIAPGHGDDVQAAKAGLMEIADVFALTKADRPDAAQLAREVRDALGLQPRVPGAWRPWVVPVAAGAGRTAVVGLGPEAGVASLVDALDAHAAHQEASGQRHTRRAARARYALWTQAERRLRLAWTATTDEVVDALAAGARDLAAEAVALLGRAAADLPGLGTVGSRERAAAPFGPSGAPRSGEDDATETGW